MESTFVKSMYCTCIPVCSLKISKNFIYAWNHLSNQQKYWKCIIFSTYDISLKLFYNQVSQKENTAKCNMFTERPQKSYICSTTCIQRWENFLTLSTSRTFPVRPNVLSMLRTANLGSTVVPAVEVSAVFLITTVVPFLTFSMVNLARSSLMFSMVGRWRSLGIPPFSSYKNSTVCLAISVMPIKETLDITNII